MWQTHKKEVNLNYYLYKSSYCTSQRLRRSYHKYVQGTEKKQCLKN